MESGPSVDFGFCLFCYYFEIFDHGFSFSIFLKLLFSISMWGTEIFSGGNAI